MYQEYNGEGIQSGHTGCGELFSRLFPLEANMSSANLDSTGIVTPLSYVKICSPISYVGPGPSKYSEEHMDRFAHSRLLKKYIESSAVGEPNEKYSSLKVAPDSFLLARSISQEYPSSKLGFCFSKETKTESEQSPGYSPGPTMTARSSNEHEGFDCKGFHQRGLDQAPFNETSDAKVFNMNCEVKQFDHVGETMIFNDSSEAEQFHCDRDSQATPTKSSLSLQDLYGEITHESSVFSGKPSGASTPTRKELAEETRCARQTATTTCSNLMQEMSDFQTASITTDLARSRKYSASQYSERASESCAGSSSLINYNSKILNGRTPPLGMREEDPIISKQYQRCVGSIDGSESFRNPVSPYSNYFAQESCTMEPEGTPKIRNRFVPKLIMPTQSNLQSLYETGDSHLFSNQSGWMTYPRSPNLNATLNEPCIDTEDVTLFPLPSSLCQSLEDSPFSSGTDKSLGVLPSPIENPAFIEHGTNMGYYEKLSIESLFDSAKVPSDFEYKYDAEMTVAPSPSSKVEDKSNSRGSAEYLCSYPGVSWNTRMQSWLVYYEDMNGRKSKTFNPKRFSVDKLTQDSPFYNILKTLEPIKIAMHQACAFAALVRYKAKLLKRCGFKGVRTGKKLVSKLQRRKMRNGLSSYGAYLDDAFAESSSMPHPWNGSQKHFSGFNVNYMDKLRAVQSGKVPAQLYCDQGGQSLSMIPERVRYNETSNIQHADAAVDKTSFGLMSVSGKFDSQSLAGLGTQYAICAYNSDSPSGPHSHLPTLMTPPFSGNRIVL